MFIHKHALYLFYIYLFEFLNIIHFTLYLFYILFYFIFFRKICITYFSGFPFDCLICFTLAMFLRNSITSFCYSCILQRRVTPGYEKTTLRVCRSLRKKKSFRPRTMRNGTRSIANLYQEIISFRYGAACNRPVYRVCVSQTRCVSIIVYTFTDCFFKAIAIILSFRAFFLICCAQAKIKIFISKFRTFGIPQASGSRTVRCNFSKRIPLYICMRDLKLNFKAYSKCAHIYTRGKDWIFFKLSYIYISENLSFKFLNARIKLRTSLRRSFDESFATRILASREEIVRSTLSSEIGNASREMFKYIDQCRVDLLN